MPLFRHGGTARIHQHQSWFLDKIGLMGMSVNDNISLILACQIAQLIQTLFHSVTVSMRQPDAVTCGFNKLIQFHGGSPVTVSGYRRNRNSGEGGK